MRAFPRIIITLCVSTTLAAGFFRPLPANATSTPTTTTQTPIATSGPGQALGTVTQRKIIQLPDSNYQFLFFSDGSNAIQVRRSANGGSNWDSAGSIATNSTDFSVTLWDKYVFIASSNGNTVGLHRVQILGETGGTRSLDLQNASYFSVFSFVSATYYGLPSVTVDTSDDSKRVWVAVRKTQGNGSWEADQIVIKSSVLAADGSELAFGAEHAIGKFSSNIDHLSLLSNGAKGLALLAGSYSNSLLTYLKPPGGSWQAVKSGEEAWIDFGKGSYSDISGTVSAVLVGPGGEIYVGGQFPSIRGDTSLSNIAVWDGAQWKDLAGGLSGPVHAMRFLDDQLIVAGNFIDIIGTKDYIASWDPINKVWSPFHDGLPTEVKALAVLNGDVYAATASNLYRATAYGSGWNALGVGNVKALESDGTQLLVGGMFTNIVGCAPADFEDFCRFIAKFDPQTEQWSGLPVPANSVKAILNTSAGLMIGGETDVGTSLLQSGSWTRLDSRFVTALASDGEDDESVFIAAKTTIDNDSPVSILKFKGEIEVECETDASIQTLAVLPGDHAVFPDGILAGGASSSGSGSNFGVCSHSAIKTGVLSTSDRKGFSSLINSGVVHLLYNTSTDLTYRTLDTMSSEPRWADPSAIPTLLARFPVLSIEASSQIPYAAWVDSDGIMLGLKLNSSLEIKRISSETAWTGLQAPAFLTAPTGVVSDQATANSSGANTKSVVLIASKYETGFSALSAFITSMAEPTPIPSPTPSTPTITPTPSPTPRLLATPYPTRTPRPWETAVPMVRISGSVFLDGAPLKNVTFSNGTRTAVTDSNGYFSFSVLPGTSYLLKPELDGYSFSPPFEFGSATADVEFAFDAAPVIFSVGGQIALDGKPLKGIIVDGGNLGATTTDDNGEYFFKDKPRDITYTVIPRAVGYSFGCVVADCSTESRLTENRRVDFTARVRNYTLGVQVKYKGVSLPNVSLNAGSLGKGKTDKKGYFAFRNVKHGTSYTITPALSGYTFDGVTFSGEATGNSTIRITALKQEVIGASLDIASISTIDEPGETDSGDVENGAVDLSGDGRFVVFSSPAADLAEDDDNSDWDVFLRDFRSNVTTRLSNNDNGRVGDGASGRPSSASRPVSISNDGQRIVFATDASNLFSGDRNGSSDIILYRAGSPNTLISQSSQGVFGDGDSSSPSISADGSSVAFVSEAANLVPGDINEVRDIFVRNIDAGTTFRVSTDSAGVEADGVSSSPAIDGTGRFVVFSSDAQNLVPGDLNGEEDIFRKDIITGSTIRISNGLSGQESNGRSWNPAISADGKIVTFASEASNLVSGDTNELQDVFVYNTETGQTATVSISSGGALGNAPSGLGLVTISDDGKYIAFASSASNLAQVDTNGFPDVFVHNREALETGLMSKSVMERVGNEASGGCAISGNGQKLSFTSFSSNLITSDRNKASDVFITKIGPLPTMFRDEMRIETPPTLVVNNKKVTVNMQLFSLLTQMNASAKKTLVYVVTLRKGKQITRKTTKRNTLTLNNMSPGSYSVSYHVELRQGSKTVAKSKESKRQRLKIT